MLNILFSKMPLKHDMAVKVAEGIEKVLMVTNGSNCASTLEHLIKYKNFLLKKYYFFKGLTYLKWSNVLKWFTLGTITLKENFTQLKLKYKTCLLNKMVVKGQKLCFNFFLSSIKRQRKRHQSTHMNIMMMGRKK